MTKDEVKKLDAIFSAKYCGPGLCEWCGMWRALQNHHLNYRRYLATRWDRENIFRLCDPCHKKAHAKPDEFKSHALKKLGRKKYFELEQRAKVVGRKLIYYEIVVKI